jgi:hypothetical protein
MDTNKLTTNRNDPDLKVIEPDGQQKKYLVLPDEERAKKFVQPYRDKYVHKKCGGLTIMGKALSETYARNPNFYDGTFCTSCGTHFPLKDENGEYNFYWDIDGTGVGEVTTIEQQEESKKVHRIALELEISDEEFIKRKLYNSIEHTQTTMKNFLNNIEYYYLLESYNATSKQKELIEKTKEWILLSKEVDS